MFYMTLYFNTKEKGKKLKYTCTRVMTKKENKKKAQLLKTTMSTKPNSF